MIANVLHWCCVAIHRDGWAIRIERYVARKEMEARCKVGPPEEET